MSGAPTRDRDITSIRLRTAYKLVVFLSCTIAACAQGGPPLLTDDPGTPGNRNWEINLASFQNLGLVERNIQVPLIDINYGWGDRIQLKYQIPYLFDRTGDGPYRGAPGNSLLGVKWRFYQQDQEGGWNVSTYPQFELNNPDHSYARGLVDRAPRFLLPVEVTKVAGPLEVNFEGGYWFTRSGYGERILGLAIGRQVTRRFEALAEIYDDVLLGGAERSTLIDVGGRYEFHRNLLLIFTAGRSVGHFGSNSQPAFISYIGLQVQVERARRKKASKHSSGPIGPPQP